MIKEGFVLRKMPGMNLVMPTGSNVKDFNGALMLNDTSAFIYEKLSEGMDITQTAKALTEVYEVSLENATVSVEKTVAQLKEAGVLE